MKHILIDMLESTEPSDITINCCIALMQPAHSAAPINNVHQASLLEGRNAALSTARALEAALQTERQGHLDHADLFGRLNQLLPQLDRMSREQLKGVLLEHETARTLRALRKG